MTKTNSPVKSLQLRFAYNDAKLDVAIWEGGVKEGKPLPSTISIRLLDVQENKNVVYMGVEDVLRLSNILQHYSFEAQETDAKRRIDAWKLRNENVGIKQTEKKEEAIPARA